MGNMIVRSAEETDLGNLVELSLSLQQHLEASNPRIWRLTEEGRKSWKQEVEEMLSDQDGRLVIAEKDDHIVGFAYGRILRRTDYRPLVVGDISRIYVLQQYRRRGVGTRLIEELCQFFSSANAQEVTLRYVLGNEEAERFWHNLWIRPVLVTASTDLKELKENICMRHLHMS